MNWVDLDFQLNGKLFNQFEFISNNMLFVVKNRRNLDFGN